MRKIKLLVAALVSFFVAVFKLNARWQFRITLLLLSFIIFQILSCRTRDSNFSKASEVNIDTLDFVKGFTLSEVISVSRFIPLETKNESLISGAYKVVQYGDRYIMLDKYGASSVFAFDTSGHFLVKYGSKGNNIGQYKLPMDFVVDRNHKELIILNSEVHDLNYYDVHTGNFKRAKHFNFPAHQFIKVNNNCFAFSGAAKDNRIIFSDSTLRRSKSYIDYSQRFSMGLLNQFTELNDSTVLFRVSYDDHIYKVENDKISPYLHVNFGPFALTNNYYDSLSEPQRQRLTEYTTVKMCNLLTYYETENNRVFTFWFNRRAYLFVQDKKTLHKKIFTTGDYRNDTLFPESFPTILGVDSEGFFLSLVSSTNMLKAFRKYSMNKTASQQVPEKMQDITELSNPIIVKFKFVNF